MFDKLCVYMCACYVYISIASDDNVPSLFEELRPAVPCRQRTEKYGPILKAVHPKKCRKIQAPVEVVGLRVDVAPVEAIKDQL